MGCSQGMIYFFSSLRTLFVKLHRPAISCPEVVGIELISAMQERVPLQTLFERLEDLGR